MIAAAAGSTGQPLRALAVLGLSVLAWLGWRAPQMAAQLNTLSGRLDAPVLLAKARPPLVSPAAVPLVRAALVMLPPPSLRLVALRPTPLQHPPDRGLLLPQPAPEATPLPPPVPPASPAPPSAAPVSPAFTLANTAYRQLRAGERRQAAALFDAALALEPGNRQWRADRRALSRRWQLGGFALLRDGGPRFNAPGSGLPGAAAGPVLGGGQLGATLAFLPDPLARRPLAIVARGFVAADLSGVRQETAQAAIGIRQTLLPGVTVSAERLIALGEATRGDWTLRLAAGGQRGRLEAYGEAGVLGSGAAYGGAQASARLLQLGPVALAAGGWASMQTGTPDVWRVDLGPSLAARWRGIRLQADWRERVAGNASPGSGPVVMLSADF
jgi:hypothetical protein